MRNYLIMQAYSRRSENSSMCPRTEAQLTYLTLVVLAAELTLDGVVW